MLWFSIFYAQVGDLWTARFGSQIRTNVRCVWRENRRGRVVGTLMASGGEGVEAWVCFAQRHDATTTCTLGCHIVVASWRCANLLFFPIIDILC